MTEEPKLRRELTLTDALALTVGTIIGTGVFLKTAVMGQSLGSPLAVLAAWVAAGLLSLAGALTYAELGAMLPRAGGEYVFLRAAYGDLPAFLYGWMRFTVAAAGSIAIYGVGFSIFLGGLVDYGAAWYAPTFHIFGVEVSWRFGAQQVTAIGAIIVFSILNGLGVVIGGRAQSFLTAVKVAAIVMIVGGVLFGSRTGNWANLWVSDCPATISAATFGAAMLAALWAFDGWNNLPMAAGEVRDPGRNIPRALIIGMVIVLAVYGLANVAYCYALPMSAIVTANSTAYPDAPPVATKAVETFLGDGGSRLVSAAFVLSSLGALNGSILTNARVPYAMARDGLFFASFARLNRAAVPAWAMTAQALWACILAVSGTFDQLTDYVVFASWVFYALATAGVFVLRRTQPEAERPYRTLGYPLVPLAFLAVAGWLIINTLLTSPVSSGIGLGIIALGLPLYWFNRRQTARAAV
ncbi:MAG: amino acid permease [Chloracidobacterium sp.]|nr:amino acid permease [Chloracidobacterium sp.]MDW8218413.1 amino acid permease [Acidobacteriota bacterium]